MTVISATKINKSFGITPVLTDVSFTINKDDRIGIVGANGAGKSTLIKVLLGELSANDGNVVIASDITTGYLKQRDHFPGNRTVEEEMLAIFSWQQKTEKEITNLSDQIAALSSKGEAFEQYLEKYDELIVEFSNRRGYSYRSEIRGILNSLAFSEDYLSKKVSLLSGGERTRLALAALLLQRPDVLLLDEPTNHLDIGTLKWLEQYLQNYKGTLVIISHDRYFLDKITNRIFEIENTKLTAYEGNYSVYIHKKRLLFEEELKHYEQVMAEINRQEEIIRRFKGHNTEKLVKRAQSREKKLAKIERPDRPTSDQARLKINFSEKLSSGNDVLYADGLSKSFGDGNERRHLFTGVHLDIKKGDRICIVGANGIGKTTLLKILLGELAADEGIIKLGQNVIPGYYDQEQKLLTPENSVQNELHSTYRLYDQQDLRKLLGRFLFHGDDVFKKVKDLAGGEKARLSLLKLMLSGANLLMMDEPTNHLDIKAKEVFEDALLSFPGTLIIISHDRYLLKKIPTAIYELQSDGIRVFLGDYDYYTEKSESLSSGKSYLDQMGKAVGTVDLAKEEMRKTEKEERAFAMQRDKEKATAERKKNKMLAQTEAQIKDVEAKIKNLEQELCNEEVFTNPQKALAFSSLLEEEKQHLNELYAIWLNNH
ncbi:MAG: ABC transporter ATP-binding protein [Clostridia bacterium]|nr:ABC transporter ATP-binding protein [Clostridia bacterium]